MGWGEVEEKLTWRRGGGGGEAGEMWRLVQVAAFYLAYNLLEKNPGWVFSYYIKAAFAVGSAASIETLVAQEVGFPKKFCNQKKSATIKKICNEKQICNQKKSATNHILSAATAWSAAWTESYWTDNWWQKVGGQWTSWRTYCCRTMKGSLLSLLSAPFLCPSDWSRTWTTCLGREMLVYSLTLEYY